MLELKAGAGVLRIRPDLGAAIVSWTRDGLDILHPVVDPNLAAQRGEGVAAYPLIPFSNRIADGRFSFGGEDFQLARNFGGEPHAIHGNAWERSWQVGTQEISRAVLVLEHAPPRDPAAQWPFRYRAEIDYALRDDGLSVRLSVRNTDDRPQPVGIGFHPFFPRDADLELGFAADSVWTVGADHLPAARVPATGAWSFAQQRPVDEQALDNCYAGWRGAAFLRWPSRGMALTITAEAPFEHLVVFTPSGKPYVAVEPASNMTDAVNRMQIPDQGLRVLAPGEHLLAETEFGLMRF